MNNIEKIRNAAALVLCILVITTSAQAGVSEGSAALGKGDYASALKEFANAARQGDVEAEYMYATMLKDGRGMVSPDKSASLFWYKRAAESGHADAQLNFGYMLYHGIGQQSDKEGGLYWYQKAAHAGVPAAQYNLAKVLWDGAVGARKPKEAKLWFRKAAEQGMAEAQLALAVALMSERRPDYDQAVKWLRLAADQGEPRAYTKLAGLYTLGRGVKKDKVQAAKWAVLAEGTGDPMARDLRIQLNRELTDPQKAQAMSQAQAFHSKISNR